MPLVLVWGLGSLAVGAGVKFFGDGIDDAATGTSKLILSLGAAGVVYAIAKKKGVI